MPEKQGDRRGLNPRQLEPQSLGNQGFLEKLALKLRVSRRGNAGLVASKRTKAKTPAWLAHATAHIRQQTHDGVAESCLWALHGAGFDFDVLEPLRRVSGVEVLR